MKVLKSEHMWAVVYLALGIYFVIAGVGGLKTDGIAALICGLIAGCAFNRVTVTLEEKEKGE